MTYRRKMIEVSLPLEAINVGSARETSIRHGHPSTLHVPPFTREPDFGVTSVNYDLRELTKKGSLAR